MRRREFITLVGSATAWPLAARAQQDQMRRVGALLSLAESDPEAKIWLEAFRGELQRLGWDQGRNIRVEYRLVVSDVERVRTEATQLVALRPDVLFTSGSAAR